MVDYLLKKIVKISHWRIRIVLTILSSTLLFFTSYSQAVSVNGTQLTGGLASSPLSSGGTNKAIFGFTLDKAGGGDSNINGITIQFTQNPSLRFSGATLYASADATYDGTDTSLGAGTINSTSIAFTGVPITSFGASGPTSKNFFVVVTVSTGVSTSTTATTASLSAADLSVSTSTTASTVSGNAYSFTSDATVSGTGTTRALNGGDVGATLATLSATSSGTAMTLSQLDFVFSVDISAVYNTSNFVLFNGSTNVGTPTYTPGTKTLSFASIGATLNTSATNYTLKGDVLAGAATSSSTVSLATAGVTVAGGTLNAVTTITNTLNVTALSATIAGTGSTRNMAGGNTAATLATFSATSSGTGQTLDQVDFIFSTDITTTFNTSNFVLFNGTTNVGTPTYTAGTKTLSFASVGASLSTSPINYTLKGDVLGTASTSSPTVSLATAGVTVTGGGTLNAFTTITNTLSVTALSTTIAGVGSTRNIVGGNTAATLATFSATSTGNGQTLDQVDFIFSTDITATFNTSNFVLFNGTTNVGTPTYTAGTKTLSFASIGATLSTSAINYTLKGDVLNTAATSSPTVSLANAGVTVTGGGTTNAFTTITNTLSVTALKATIAGTGSTRNMAGGDTGVTLATFSATSTGTTQTLDQIDVVFSVDIASVFNTSNFVLFNGTTNVGTPTYTPGTKTLSFASIGAALSSSPINYTLKGDVLLAATASSQTVALATSGVTITGGGTLNAVTTITNTLNVSALAATISGAGAPRNLNAGATAQTLATFSAVSTGSAQSISQIAFVFSADVAAVFTTYVLNNGSGNVGTPSYNAGSKTLTFTTVNDALSTSVKNYTLKADVLPGASAATYTVDLANSGVTITGGGTLNAFTTITNTLNVTYSATSDIIKTPGGAAINPTTIAFAEYNKKTTQLTYTNYTTGNTALLATFRLRDGAGSSDGDSQATTIQDLYVDITNSSFLQEVIIFDNTNTAIARQTAGATVTFSSIGISAADNVVTGTDFSVRAVFIASGLTDNAAIAVSINSSTTALASGSQFKSVNPFSTATNSPTLDIQASKIVLSGLAPSPPIAGATASQYFSLTASATDANGNVDANRTNTVTLSKALPASGTYVLTSASNLAQSMVAGTYTWNDLLVNLATSYTLSAAYGGLTSGTISFNAASLGVGITYNGNSSPTAVNICSGNYFATLETIHITENDPSDFHQFTSGAFYLKLPTGFVFNPSSGASVSFTGGNDISSMTALSSSSYLFGNTVVKLVYSVTGTSNIDDFTITGLQAQFTGSSASPGQNITVIDGSAVITGDQEVNNKSHGLLNGTISSNTAYDFIVSAFPGQSPIASNLSQFSTSVQGVILKAKSSNPVGATGVSFSGNGVSFSLSQNAYIFSPSSVGSGTFPITFTCFDASGCQITVTRNFTVYVAGIQGLATQYCANEMASQILTVSSIAYQGYPSWDNTTNYNLYDYISYGNDFFYSTTSGNIGNVPPSPGTSNLFWQFAGHGYTLAASNPYVIYVPSYKTMTGFSSNGAGTLTITLPSHGFANGAQVYLYAYIYDNSFNFLYYVQYQQYTISNVTTNTFDISDPASAGVLPNGPYVNTYGYIIIPNPSVTAATWTNSTTISITAPAHGMQAGSRVRVYLTGFTDTNDSPADHIDNWYPISNVTANSFDITTTGTFPFLSWGNYGYVDIFNYRFNSPFVPANIQTLNSNFGVVTQAYVGFLVDYANGGCVKASYQTCSSFIYSYSLVQLFQPPVLDFSGLNPSYCINASIATLTGNFDGSFTAIPGISDGGINNPGATFDPSNNGITPETSIVITFSYVDNNQCSNSITKSTIVHKLPIVDAGADVYICKNTTTAVIGGAVPATPASQAPFNYSWTTTAGLDNPLLANPTASPTIATNYTLTVTDVNGCIDSDQIQVNVNNPAGVFAGNDFVVCTGSPIALSAANANISAPATKAWWGVPVDPNGTSSAFTNNTTGTTFNTTSTYDPSASDIAAGKVTFTLSTDDPDGTGPTGPCPIATGQVNVQINLGATANAGLSKTFCSSALAFTAGYDYTGAIDNTIQATPNGIGVTWSVQLGNGQGSVNNINQMFGATYTPSVSELNNGATVILKLTTDDPDTGGPCLPAVSTVSIDINPRAQVTITSVPSIVCAHQNVTLQGQYSGGATQATWTTNGIGTGLPVTVASGAGPKPVNALYTLDITERQSPPSLGLVFTLTSDDPDLGGPCPVATDSRTVTVEGIPNQPSLTTPGFPPSPNNIAQTAYCSQDPILPVIAYGSTSSNVTINWYSVTDPTANSSGVSNLSGNINHLSLNNGSVTYAPVVNTTLLSSQPTQITQFWVTQTSTNGCESLAQFSGAPGPVLYNVVVNPKPNLSFTVDKLCEGDTATYDASPSTIASGTVAQYAWDFNDGTGQVVALNSSSSTQIVTHIQPKMGTYDAILTGVSDQGCLSTTKASLLPPVGSLSPVNPLLPGGSAIIIGPYPIPDMKVVLQCEGDDTQFNGFDNSTNTSKNNNVWAWDFGDATSGSGQSTTHQYASVGLKTITLQITTDRGCVAQASQNIPILPYLNSSSLLPYAEDFETNNGFWVPDGYFKVVNGSSTTTQSGNSWHYTGNGSVTTVNAQTGATGQFWITNTGTGYNDNERSILYGPCVDLSQNFLTKPVFSVDYYSNTEDRNDGVAVEVSIDDGANWTVLGAPNSGLNWYNRQNISGLSVDPSISPVLGQQLNQKGFTGDTPYDVNLNSYWTTGKYRLDNFLGEPRLRLRFMFGTNGNNPQAYDGFAIDNIKIEDRNRIILAENFTNLNFNCTGCPGNLEATAVPNIQNFSDFGITNFTIPGVVGIELVKVEYHTTFGDSGPTPDKYNKQNPADNAARASFYGVTNRLIQTFPYPFVGFLDGYTDGSGTSEIDPVVTNWAMKDFDSRSLVSSPIDIVPTIANPVGKKGFTVSATITANQDLDPKGRYVVMMAIVEQVDNVAGTTGTSYILRKMLPDAAGIPLTISTKGQMQVLPDPAIPALEYYWEVDGTSGIDITKLSAIVFVQDLQRNKEVLQSSLFIPISGLSVATSVEDWEHLIQVYPVPSDDQFNIKLPAPAPQEMKVSLSDQMGKVVHAGSFNEGEQTKAVSTQGMAAGVYILHLGENGSVARRKVIVVHK